MAFYTAARFPAWQGNLFVGALKFRSLYRLVLRGDQIIGQERLLRDLGQRIRDVRQGPDGALYVLTDSARGQIIRVQPRPVK
jgi:glucose/arabinose dehydrogenase